MAEVAGFRVATPTLTFLSEMVLAAYLQAQF